MGFVMNLVNRAKPDIGYAMTRLSIYTSNSNEEMENIGLLLRELSDF